MTQVGAKLPFSSKKQSGLIVAAQNSQEKKLAVIAHNLAMADVTGAKSGTIRFKEFVFQTPEGENISSVRIEGVVYDFTQGALKQTGIKTHIALNGKGFFKIRTPGGDFYTRNGEFQISPKGLLTNALGYPVLSQKNKPITIGNGKNIHIDQKGNIFVDEENTGRIGIVDFKDYKNIKLQGLGIYTAEPPETNFEGSVEQGSLERSNISTMNEIVELTFTQRHFEAAQKLLDEYEKSSKRMMNTSARNA